MTTAAPSAARQASAPSCAQDPYDLACKYFEKRGLSVDLAQRAGIGLVQDARAISPKFKKRVALVIPYFDPLTGKPVTYGHGEKAQQFLRVRYLGDETVKGFVKQKKPQRYAQAAGSPVFAYFAPLLDWSSLLPDPEVPLVLTEGEAKALAGVAVDIPTIALGGVDSIKNNGAFLPELEAIPWHGRHAIICFDSDRVEKAGVLAAERRLTHELCKRGAIVHIAQLPHAPDGEKLGLDDAIYHYGFEWIFDLLTQAEVAPDAVVIDLAPQNLIENLKTLDEAFAASPLPIYQRSVKIVHVAAAGETIEEDDVRRAAEAPIIREVTIPACQQLAMRVATFQKWNAAKKGAVPTECSSDFARHYLEKVDGWRVSGLTGIVEAPTLRPDGSVIQEPGYDAASGILYLPSDDFPRVPDNPTQAEAKAAYEALRSVVRGFEFGSPEAESVWVAAAMTGVVRKGVRTAPLFAISAPVMGAGKTLAADLVSIIATGHEPAVMSQGHSADEDRKRLLSVLMRGDAIVQIDNCELPIEGDALCSILTSPVWQERVLGRSETITVPTNATFLATGNNLIFKGDMSTRAIMCRIIPKTERPEERDYRWDAREEVRTNRPALVAAASTIIRGYFAVGCPKVEAKTFGRFEEWQRLVQFPLLWLGAPDPCKTREMVERNDPDRETFERLIGLWAKVFGTQPVRAAEFTKLQSPGLQFPPEARDQARELFELASEISGGKGRDVLNVKAFGEFLSTKEDRLVGGYRLMRGEDRKRKVATWQLCQP